MHIAVDGTIFETQGQGGISRIFTTILPLMCDLDPQLAISLYMARPAKRKVRSHPQIHGKRILPLDSRIFRWTNLTTQQRRGIALSLRALAHHKHAIWHSTYYSLPVRWSGPQIVTVYDLIYFRYLNFFKNVSDENQRQQMTRAITAADQILCISQTTAQDVIDHFKVAPHRVQVIHLAASPTFRPLPDKQGDGLSQRVLPTTKPYLLYIGGRNYYKNFVTLLEAYCRWPQHNEVDLVVVGTPWTAQEMENLVANRIADKVHLFNNATDEELNILYNGALAFVYPSLYEGFGIPLLEAMAVGCPIIASDIPSSREIACDYPIYFPANNIDALCAALDTVWPDSVEMGSTSAQHPYLGQTIAAQYSWEQTARKILQAYYTVSSLPLPPQLETFD